MRIFFLILILIAEKTSFGQGLWTPKADFGGGYRAGTVGFCIGTKGYVGTGIDNFGNKKNDFWEYNPINDSWTQKANFAGAARYWAVGFSIGNNGYIGSGFNGSLNTYYNDFWKYNPSTNTWSAIANFPGAKRYNAIGFSTGSKAYFGIGRDSSLIFKNDFWEYDTLTNIWTQKNSFAGTARGPAVVFSIGNNLYVGTGNDSVGPTKDFWEYNTVSNTWIQKANLPVSRCNATGFAIGMKGYILTGIDSINNTHNDFWEYDIISNNWIQKVNFPGNPRMFAVGFSIGQKGYIGTGDSTGSGAFLKDFWEYDPNGNSINETNFINSISIFPNPATNHFTIEAKENKIFSLRIINKFGQKVTEKKFQKKTEVDISSYNRGLFLIEVCDERCVKCHTEKVLIE